MGVKVEGMDDVLKLLDKYSNKANVDEVAKKAVGAAKAKVAASMRSAIASSEHGSRSTGSAASSVSATEEKVNSYGAYSVARPTGHDAKGKRNGEKAAYLEYGSPTLTARPWRKKAIAGAEKECIKIMEKVVASELGAE